MDLVETETARCGVLPGKKGIPLPRRMGEEKGLMLYQNAEGVWTLLIRVSQSGKMSIRIDTRK
jgi:hypothetical protein